MRGMVEFSRGEEMVVREMISFCKRRREAYVLRRVGCRMVCNEIWLCGEVVTYVVARNNKC